jgi:two-component system, LytTR family, sensor kinase
MSRYINPILHLAIALVIIVLAILALIINPGFYHFSNTINYFLANLINLGVYYLIFAYAVPKFLMKGKNIVFYSGLAGVIILSGLAKLGVLYLVQQKIPNQIFVITLDTSFSMRFFLSTFMSLCFAVLGAFLRFSVDWFKNRQQLLKMELELKTAELAMLKYQMYPHFLFNTLNNIYALTKKSDPRASESMAKLSDILRYLLYQSEEGMVNLNDDLDILTSFVDLELLRKEDPEFISWTQTGNAENLMLPPMLLLPLVENAFKHGAGQIMPVIEVACHIEHNRLNFSIKNSKSPTSICNIDASGIGLVNVKKRLNLAYPGKSKLRIEDGSESFSVSLQISF